MSSGLTWTEVALHNRYVADLADTQSAGQTVINRVARQRDAAAREAAGLRRQLADLQHTEGVRRLARINAMRAARGL